MTVLKNVLIIVLFLSVLGFWLTPEDYEEEDLDIVTVEYRCSLLGTYENVPLEVKEECYSRREQDKRTDI